MNNAQLVAVNCMRTDVLPGMNALTLDG